MQLYVMQDLVSNKGIRLAFKPIARSAASHADNLPLSLLASLFLTYGKPSPDIRGRLPGEVIGAPQKDPAGH